ncbi:penicillin-binding protein activator [Tateyamaria sp.]|jgi:ABC-type branched-subunit amino acid transport system substrate-binding protein|nr:penicillin-binding protein activator [Tateyamaria sp.]MDG2055823.1 penicillin-binding protein activator [Tateyamaria sp.]
MFAFLKSLRKRAWLAAVPVAAFMLSACDPAAIGGSTGPRFDTSRPVPVALLVPRGSEQLSDGLLAQNLENAARLAMRDLRGVEIDLRVYDTAGNAQTAATQAAQAVNDGAKIILGPLYAEAANAAGVAVASRNVNVLAFSNNTTIAGDNVFVLGPTFDSTAARLVSHAVQEGNDRIVIVHAQDVAGQLGSKAIQRAIARNGATFAGSVGYPLSQQDVVAAIPIIRSTISENGANAVFMTATTAAGLPLLTQLLPEAGVSPETTQYIGLTRWDIPPQTLQLPGVQGGWFALPDPQRSAAFTAQYEDAYEETPHPLAGLAFDGIAAIGALVRQGNVDALSSASLTQNAGFQGASGVFRLLRDGTNERGLAVASVDNKKVVVISPAPRSFGRAGF